MKKLKQVFLLKFQAMNNVTGGFLILAVLFLTISSAVKTNRIDKLEQRIDQIEAYNDEQYQEYIFNLENNGDYE